MLTCIQLSEPVVQAQGKLLSLQNILLSITSQAVRPIQHTSRLFHFSTLIIILTTKKVYIVRSDQAVNSQTDIFTADFGILITCAVKMIFLKLTKSFTFEMTFEKSLIRLNMTQRKIVSPRANISKKKYLISNCDGEFLPFQQV